MVGLEDRSLPAAFFLTGPPPSHSFPSPLGALGNSVVKYGHFPTVFSQIEMGVEKQTRS